MVAVGGASVGDHDLVKPALGRLGLKLEVESVSRAARQAYVVRDLGGRPQASWACLAIPLRPWSAAELFLHPLLSAWQGADPTLRIEAARLLQALPPTGPREHWMRATLQAGADGVSLVTPLADQDSSLVTVFAQANSLLRRPAGAPAMPEGAAVNVLRLDRL